MTRTKKTGAPARGGAGNPWHLIEFFKSIRPRKIFENSFIARKKPTEALSLRLVSAREEERRELARELHDRIGQKLTALSLNLRILRFAVEGADKSKALEKIQDSADLLEATGAAIQDVLSELRPPMLQQFGLRSALEWFATHYFSRRCGTKWTMRSDLCFARNSPEIELGLFRVAQEVLNNVCRHARADNVMISLHESPTSMELCITDDGAGFNMAEVVATKPCFGLITMQERCESLGGTFETRSRIGGGTSVRVTLQKRA